MTDKLNLKLQFATVRRHELEKNDAGGENSETVVGLPLSRWHLCQLCIKAFSTIPCSCTTLLSFNFFFFIFLLLILSSFFAHQQLKASQRCACSISTEAAALRSSSFCLFLPVTWDFDLEPRNIMLLPGTSLASVESLSLPLVQEVVLSADIRCAECQRRIAEFLSRLNDTESLSVNVLEKKITLTCRYPALKASTNQIPAIYRNPFRKMTVIKRLFRASCN